jgi:hypothetical protein
LNSFEDITDPSLVEQNPKMNRNITVYGYLRGTHLKAGQVSCLCERHGVLDCLLLLSLLIVLSLFLFL